MTERVKVGEVEHKTTSGQTYAKSEVYQDRTRDVQYQVWRSYQGDAPISDDDLYRIANDKIAEQEVADRRETGVTLNRVGVVGIVAGVGGIVGGYALSASATPGEGAPVGTYVTLGSTVVAGVGGLLTYIGFKLARGEHPLSQERAAAAAARYNRTLGTVSDTSTTSAPVIH